MDAFSYLSVLISIILGLAITQILQGVCGVVISGGLPSRTNVTFHVLFFALWSLAAISRSEWYHAALPFVMIVSVVAYIALLFRQL
jgi:hypothetical protein